MLSKLLRQLLYILVHLVVKILVAVQNVSRRLCSKNCNLSKEQVTKRDVLMLLENVPKMKNKLKHLVVLADSNVHTISELAQLVIWNLVVGVPYVSFYDVTGSLKKMEEELFYEIERNKKGIPGCIKWSNKPDLNGYTNGIQANTVFVNIFSYSDGKPRIAQCIKLIAKGDLQCDRMSKEFTAQEFGEAFMKLNPAIPDPDLVIFTGPLCCTFGLLPWQIRLTEFIQVDVHHNININCYLGALYKYNKCDQRFGK
ncbi:dehydrodolichyl diphosphate synthase complex subunit Nus1 [Vanessa atalanta]|uniref:dehydrodolichyl diphosphate synthase complex subunit Nus1 n=1 Tax=Vanessa atalanta TaxID=42275 RepID=UPI001FCDA6E2|nr:dehydrodolichyl diphosphate synthase complex subunit Nus1 [Vanessa atalanta]